MQNCITVINIVNVEVSLKSFFNSFYTSVSLVNFLFTFFNIPPPKKKVELNNQKFLNGLCHGWIIDRGRPT